MTAMLPTYVLGRAIESNDDIRDELHRAALALAGRVRYRGPILRNNIQGLSPPAEPLDMMLVYEPSSGVYEMWLVMSIRPQRIAKWEVTIT